MRTLHSTPSVLHQTYLSSTPQPRIPTASNCRALNRELDAKLHRLRQPSGPTKQNLAAGVQFEVPQQREGSRPATQCLQTTLIPAEHGFVPTGTMRLLRPSPVQLQPQATLAAKLGQLDGILECQGAVDPPPRGAFRSAGSRSEQHVHCHKQPGTLSAVARPTQLESDTCACYCGHCHCERHAALNL